MMRVLRRSVTGLGLALLALSSAACAAPKEAPPAASPQSRLDSLRSELDRDLLAGPSVTDRLGFRTLWQARIDSPRSATPVATDCVQDAILTWDSFGIVTRVRGSTGDTMWQAATISKVDRILSATIVPTTQGERAAVVTDTQCFLLDAGNGHFVNRQPFDRIANTPADLAPPFLIYGTRAGQIVWHDYEVGFDSYTNQLKGLLSAAPRRVGRFVIAGSTGGSVSVFSVANSRLQWERFMNAGIGGRIAADERAAWVPCRDQYLWCLSIDDGRTLWKYFSQSPLTADPTLLDDALYMQLPDEGLVCFEPLPKDKLDGVIRWRAAGVPGNVVGVCRAGLIVWDRASRTLTLLEERSGATVLASTLSSVVDLDMTDPLDGDIVLTGENGRMQRLTPVARRPATAPPAAAAATADRNAPGDLKQ